MTVSELIEKLLLLPPDWPVYVRGYERGVNDVADVHSGHFIRNVNYEYWLGDHEEPMFAGGRELNGVELQGKSRHEGG